MRKLLKFFEPKKTESVEIPVPPKKPKITSEKPVVIKYVRGSKDAAWNPLIGFPNNLPCWCGSGTKAKRCCKPRVNRVISQKLATDISQKWERYLNGDEILPGSDEWDRLQGVIE